MQKDVEKPDVESFMPLCLTLPSTEGYSRVVEDTFSCRFLCAAVALLLNLIVLSCLLGSESFIPDVFLVVCW